MPAVLKCLKHSILCSERGNVVFFATILIPISLTLSVLAVDVSKWQSLRNVAQSDADRISLQAARALPDTIRAKQIISQNVASLPYIKGFDFHLTSSSATVTINSEVEAFFDAFLELHSGHSTTLTINVSATAQTVPSDTVIIMSDAETLRPDAKTTWGDELSWPASKIFDFVNFHTFTNLNFTNPDKKTWVDWPVDWDSSEFQRWVTQACFNPALNPIKFSAIYLADFFGAKQNNRISLLFTPGNSIAVGSSTVRNLSYPEQTLTTSQASWRPYYEQDNFIGDELCTYIADYQITGDDTYALNKPSFELGLIHQTNYDCDEIALHTDSYYPPTGNLDTCYLKDNLLLREAIYFHAATRIPHFTNGENITNAIEQALFQFLNTKPVPSLDQTLRGNLANNSLRNIIVLTDNIPDPTLPRFVELTQDLQLKNIQLIFIVFEHPYLSTENQLSAENRVELLEKLLQSKSNNIKILVADSGEKLINEIIPKVASFSQEVALKS
jgi:hypothetical protein